MLSQYEQSRADNIAKNKALLQSLGLDRPKIEPKEQRKRKADEAKCNNISQEPVLKIQRLEAGTEYDAPTSDVRRSARNAGKDISYTREHHIDSPQPLLARSSSSNTGPMGRESGRRIHDPKTYGHIPGIPIGTWWLTREMCSRDAVHAPWVAGIAQGSDGAPSIALSGGYDDDVDLGYAFTYTGSGGRDLKGTKQNPKNLRTAPQSSDQSFDNNFNKVLKRSCETKKPVRVVRGYKLKSKYAPSEGYRYDGLYRVEKAWMEKGLNPKGYLVCKFALKRLPNQPPLPVKDDSSEGDEAEENNEENEIEADASQQDDC